MKVRLLEPIDENAAKYQIYKTAYARAVCTMNEDKIDPEDIYANTKKVQSLIDSGHTSVLEHINYTFELSDISRALLQELSRHRHTSPTVQSTRWALKKMNTKNIDNTIYIPEELNENDREDYINSVSSMLELRKKFTEKYSNDIAKYLTPECMYTKEILSINARSLLNMMQLRTSEKALKEFRALMYEIYKALPSTHKFIFCNYFGDCGDNR